MLCFVLFFSPEQLCLSEWCLFHLSSLREEDEILNECYECAVPSNGSCLSNVGRACRQRGYKTANSLCLRQRNSETSDTTDKHILLPEKWLLTMLRPKDLCQGSGTKTFLEAMNSGKVHLARFVLDALDGRIINSKTESSRTPLMLAVCQEEYSTRSKFTQLLLEKGADVNSRDENGRTALSLSCELGHLDAVKLLVQFNANPELTDTWGNSALMYAAYGGHSQILDFLIRAFKRLGLRLDHTNHAGHSAIQVAEQLGHENCVQVLSGTGKKGLSGIKHPEELLVGLQEVPWPNRLPKQMLEKFSKQIQNKQEDVLPTLIQKHMWIGDDDNPKRRFSQHPSPLRTSSSGYQSLPRLSERHFTDNELHVKQLQNTRDQNKPEPMENPPQWGKAKSFNLDLRTGRKQSYQGDKRDILQPASQLKRASLQDEKPLRLYCHNLSNSDKAAKTSRELDGINSVPCVHEDAGAKTWINDISKEKKNSIKRGSVIKNERPSRLLFNREELPKERIKIRPPGFEGLRTRLLRRFTAPEFMGLVRDRPCIPLNRGKIARSETFPLSYTHKFINSQPSVDSVSGVRCEFESSPPVSRA